MKNLNRIAIVISCIVMCCIVEASFAKQKQRKDSFQLSPVVANTVSLQKLREFLASSDRLLRRSAVKRLGEIGSEDAIPVLLEAFENEKPVKGMDAVPVVRRDILLALESIGGAKARKAIHSLLDDLLKKGPKYKRYVWEDRDYVVLSLTAIRILGERADSDVLETIGQICFDDSMYWRIRQRAYKWYLLNELKSQDTDSVEKAVEWLVAKLTGRGAGGESDWVKGRPGVKTLEAIRNGAIVEILTDFGRRALPALEQQVSMGRQDRKSKGPRTEALDYVIRRIRMKQSGGISVTDEK